MGIIYRRRQGSTSRLSNFSHPAGRADVGQADSRAMRVSPAGAFGLWNVVPLGVLYPGKEKDSPWKDVRGRAVTAEVTHTLIALFSDTHPGVISSSRLGF